jgi:large subunit ribosomal protein L6
MAVKSFARFAKEARSMSRVAKNPIAIPKGVEIKIDGTNMVVKGAKGQLTHTLSRAVTVSVTDNSLIVEWDQNDTNAKAQAGTTRAVLNNLVAGVSAGFERKLTLIGVGYRAQAKGKVLGLTLGYSHPIEFEVPEGITVDTPSQTEIIIKGYDKQKIGEVAAKIRAYRPPEPYKGKGVRYADEFVERKEAKKK